MAGDGAFKGTNFYLAARKALIAIGRCSSPHIMADHGQCALCGAPDSWKHSLLECNMVSCVWVLESEEIVEHLSEMDEENSRGWLANLFQTMSHADLYSDVGNYVGNLVCKKEGEGLENKGLRIKKVLEMKTCAPSEADEPCYRRMRRS